jgi:hypothetical protein
MNLVAEWLVLLLAIPEVTGFIHAPETECITEWKEWSIQ